MLFVIVYVPTEVADEEDIDEFKKKITVDV